MENTHDFAEPGSDNCLQPMVAEGENQAHETDNAAAAEENAAPAESPAAEIPEMFRLSDEDIVRIVDAVFSRGAREATKAAGLAEGQPSILAHIRRSFWDK